MDTSDQFMIILSVAGSSVLINGAVAQNWDQFIKAATDKAQIEISHSYSFSFRINDDQACKMTNAGDYDNMLMLRAMTGRTVLHISFLPHKSQAARTEIIMTQPHQPQNTSNVDRTHVFDLNMPPLEDNTPAHNTVTDSFTLGDRLFHAIPSPHSNSQNLSNPNRPASQNHNHAPPQTPAKKTNLRGSSKRPCNMRSPFTDEPTIPSQMNNQAHDSANLEAQFKSSKRTTDIARGEFFEGATDEYPIYETNQTEEATVLRSANWVYYIEGVGQNFRGGVTEFRHKLVMYSSKIGFKFKYLRNDSVYISAKCALSEKEACCWFVKGAVSSVTQYFVIKDCNLKHTCTLSVMGNDSERLGCRLIGNLISDVIRAKPTLTATDIKRELLTYYGFTVPYEKVWRAVEVARANVFGGYADSFDELRWYSEAIRRTNPGSEVFLETDPKDNRFQRFFLAFHASLEGFKKCRPMLFVDGTFMKTKYKGTLLAATAKDGNNGLFPVAIAVVDGENSANWLWFISKIKDLVHHPQEIMFVSDRAGGLMAAFDEVYEKPLHFFCLYHLMQNLRSMYKGKKYSDVFKSSLCKLLKEAAYAPNKQFFAAAIHKFKLRGGPEAVHFLKDLPPEKWAIAFAPDVHRYGELTSNAAESFNSWILDARSLPITFMIDCIRMKMMKWFSNRRDEADRWTGALTARAEELWNQYDSLGDGWNVRVTNQQGVYEVLCQSSTLVNLNNKTCSCYQWQIRGFPCSHAIAVIKRSKWHIRQLVDSCFFSDTYKEIYAENIYAIPSTEKFEIQNLPEAEKIKPPIIRRQPGRPRMKRFKVDSQGAKQREFICGRCGEYGTHYWTTCKDALEE